MASQQGASKDEDRKYSEGSETLEDTVVDDPDDTAPTSSKLKTTGDRKDSQQDTDSEDDFDLREITSAAAKAPTASQDYTDTEERTVLRKFDRRLILFLGLLYLLSFLDRSNIGNARIAGMDSSLGLSSNQYEWLLTVFYITYISFQWMILLYKLVPAHVYISLCVLSWGIVACLQSLTTSFVQMLALRGVLGVGEAAFSPGLPFYMTFFYRRSELAYRVGLQISAAPLASSFASSLAWLIVKLSQGSPMEPWRALFLFEGFPAIFVAIVAWYSIPDSPSSASYLTPRECRVAELRLQHDTVSEDYSTTSVNQSSTTRTGLQGSELLRTLLDPKSYLTALMFLSVNVAFSSLPPFLPSVINDMNFSALTSQALAAPPYLLSFGFVLLISYLSDKTPDSRGVYIIAVSLLSSLSYGMIAVAGGLHYQIGDTASVIIRYLSIYGAAMGFFSAVTLIITWTLNNQPSATGRGMGMTILNVIGQCGPLIGVRLFPKSQAPYYVQGMTICAAFMLGVAALALALRLYLQYLNARNARVVEYEMVEQGQETRAAASEALMGTGKRKDIGHASFRFML